MLSGARHRRDAVILGARPPSGLSLRAYVPTRSRNCSNPCKAGGITASAGPPLLSRSASDMEPSRTHLPPDLQNASLAVSGMTCGSCVQHVHHALAGLVGVRSAQVDRARGLARVAYDPAEVDTDQLVAAVVDAGYDARVMAS